MTSETAMLATYKTGVCRITTMHHEGLHVYISVQLFSHNLSFMPLRSNKENFLNIFQEQ